MSNKDGVVSIGFSFKKELEETCSIIEKELNNIGGDVNLSEGLKKQIKELKTALESLQKDFSTSFEKIGKSKLDTKTFADFEKKVNKQLSSIRTEIGNLKSQLGSIDSSVGIDNISKQLNNLDSSAKKATKAVSDLIGQTKSNQKQNTFIDTDSTIKGLQEVKRLLADVSKEDYDFGYGSKSAADLTKSLDGLIDKYYKIESEIDELSSSMQNIDKGTQTYKEAELQLSKMRLELGKCALEMDDILGATNSEKINWSKTFLNEDDLVDLVDNTLKELKKFKSEAQSIISSTNVSIEKKTSSNSKSKSSYDLSKNKISIPVSLSTKQSTINKQLDEMIANLQERAAKSPIIAPVKLRVDSEYEKSEKDTNAPEITQNQIDEARKSTEGVIPGLEKAFNNSMRIATNKAVETAKESIKSVREFFETNPITVHLTVPDDEKVKIGKAILSEDGKTTVDISGQVDKAKKTVKELSEDLEKSQLLIKENVQNAKNLSLEKLVNSLSETMTQFSELKGIISSIQNMENTVARASGISSTGELVEQWGVVEKTIINATKLDGDFRKNANIGKIVSEYQKYIDMGGTNTLSGIDKIKDNEKAIDSILSKIKELKSQDVENDSIQKLSVDLDSVIAKFDELISTVKTATNSLYKVIKAGNVSELDKQWSSISDKFKSFADESGKINLNKQKKDVKELIVMFQKYESMGGTNSLSNITDNVETLRKLDNEYKKLNQTKEVDNSANIKKELSSFNEVEKSVDSLTTAIGNTKVQAINVEATAMENAAEREILAIRGILDNLNLILDRLNSIKGIKLPKFDVGNIDIQKALESLNDLSGNKSNISLGMKDIIQGESKLIDPSTVTSYSSVLDQLSKSLQEINTLTNIPEIFKGLKVTEKQTSNLTLLQESLELINVSLKKIDADPSSGNFLNQITELTKQADALKDLASILKSVKGKIKEVSESVVDDLASKKTAQLQSIQSIIDKYQPKLDSYKSREHQSNDYISKINEIKNAINELRVAKNALENSPSIATEDEMNHVKDLEKIIRNSIESMKNMPSVAKGVSKNAIEKLISKISKALDKNTRYSKKAKSELRGYLELLETKNPSLNLEKIEAGFLRITNEERRAGREGKSFFDVFKNKTFYNFVNRLAVYYLSMYDFIRYARNGINAIRELDTALIDLQKTTIMNTNQLEDFYYASNDVAKKMGVTTKEIIEQASAWSRLGYSSKEASTQMARLSSQFASISPGMDTDQAQEGLVSIMKAWGISEDKVKSEIMDPINTLGKFIAQTYSNVWCYLNIA